MNKQSIQSTTKNFRNISPIRRNKDESINPSLNHTHTMKLGKTSPMQLTTTLSTTSNKYKTFSPLSDVKYPKNINEYIHLIETRNLAQSDLDWTLDLRTYKKQNTQPTSHPEIITSPPSFYEDDFMKFKTCKNKCRLMVDPFTLKDNSYSLAHLVKGNVNFIDKSMLNFETTLRHFHLPKGVKPVNHKSNWKSIAYNKTDVVDKNKSLPPLKDTKTIEKIDKFVFKNYITSYGNIKFGDNTIKIRKLLPDKGSNYVKLGEHLSLREYNGKYDSKNIQGIRHILRNHTNSLAKFEIGLREGYETTSRDYNNKIRNGSIAKNFKIKKQRFERNENVDLI